MHCKYTARPFYFRPQNMIAQSQSGTGKTAAFVLTMLSRCDPEYQHPQVEFLIESLLSMNSMPMHA